jgi:hypothetical protein
MTTKREGETHLSGERLRRCIADDCNGSVPWDQGSDYCAACIEADAPTTTAHTAGPWQVGDPGSEVFEGVAVEDGKRVVWSADGMEICLVRDRGGMTPTVARLIAAAPAMLEALEEALANLNDLTLLGRTVIDRHPDCDWDCVAAAITSARAAIRAAKGGS